MFLLLFDGESILAAHQSPYVAHLENLELCNCVIFSDYFRAAIATVTGTSLLALLSVVVLHTFSLRVFKSEAKTMSEK